MLAIAAALALALLLAVPSWAARPHILLICVDDFGRTDTGIYGKSNIPMPNIVNLAKEGAVLENFYTQTVCSPTRSSLMVGRYPFRMGTQHVTTIGPGMTGGIPLDTPILPQLLKNVGYDTHMIGKWHCGYATWQHTPYFRGFKSYLGYLQAQGDYYKHNTAMYPAPMDKVLDGLDFWENDKPLYGAVGNYSLDMYDAAMTRVLDTYAATYNSKVKREDHPLFIYLAHQTVHIPLQPRRDEKERCGHLKHATRRVYCSMMVEVDDSFGSMVAQFKKHNLWDNTLVLLLTDNGGMVNWDQNADGSPKFPASQGSNFPLRGSKMTMFEGGVRSLAFISGGAYPKQHAGKRFKGLAHVVDLSATVLAAAELFPLNREQLQLDGNDLMPLITNSGLGKQRTDVPINIINAGAEYSAIRFSKYKLIVKDHNLVEDHNTMDKAKLVQLRGWYDENGDLLQRSDDVSDKTLLFDLEADEQERNDLAAKRPDLVQYGLDLIKSYVVSRQYMEPQGGQTVHPEAYPLLHGGVWRPFQSEKVWRRNFAKQQREANIGDSIAEEEVKIPSLPHF